MLPSVILRPEGVGDTFCDMRASIVVLVLVASLMGQTPGSADPKSIYDQAMNKLTGVPPSRNEFAGIDLMNRAADLGYEPAQVALGYIYESGSVVAASPEKSAAMYRKAAAQDSHLAKYLLGRLYFLGLLTGGRVDSEKWLQPAADAGNPFAAYLLGLALYERDPAAAIPRFRAAAEQGLPYAQFRLGRALIEGRVLPVNKREAYLWLYVSNEAGVSEAALDMSQLESLFGSVETEKAKSEARDLQARVRRSANAKQCTGWTGELDSLPTPPPLSIRCYCE
jgi:TPR repeat protein